MKIKLLRYLDDLNKNNLVCTYIFQLFCNNQKSKLIEILTQKYIKKIIKSKFKKPKYMLFILNTQKCIHTYNPFVTTPNISVT